MTRILFFALFLLFFRFTPISSALTFNITNTSSTTVPIYTVNVSSTDLFGKEYPLNYFLLDVVRQGATRESYQLEVATNLTTNDCSDNVLRQYLGLRQSFCIQHSTGQIFLTKYFSVINNAVYRMSVRVSNGTRSYDFIVEAFVLTPCDQFKSCKFGEWYNYIKPRKNDTFVPLLPLLRMYLTRVVYDEIDDDYELTITRGNKAVKLILHQNISSSYLFSPILVYRGENVSVRLTRNYNPVNLKGNITFGFLSPNDFCRDSKCIALARHISSDNRLLQTCTNNSRIIRPALRFFQQCDISLKVQKSAYNFTAGMAGQLDGCEIMSNSSLKISSSYWIKDGSKIKDAPIITKGGLTKYLKDYDFLDIYGTFYFQCAIEMEGVDEAIVSPQIEVVVAPATVTFERSPYFDGNMVHGCRFKSSLKPNQLSAYISIILPNRMRKRVKKTGSSVDDIFKNQHTVNNLVIIAYYQIGSAYLCEITSIYLKDNVFSSPYSTSEIEIEVPKVLSNPVIYGLQKNYIGNPITLGDCKFSSKLKLKSSQVGLLIKGKFEKVTFVQINDTIQLTNFTFTPTRVSESGKYRCIVKLATLDKEIISKPVNLEILDVDIELISHPKVELYKGQVIIRGCQYNVSQNICLLPYSYWSLNGKRYDLVNDNDSCYEFVRERRDNGPTIFSISDLYISNKYESFGKYKCIVDIGDKHVESQEVVFNLTSETKFNVQPSSPNINLTVGQKIIIRGCQVYSEVLDSNFFWLFNGRDRIQAKTVRWNNNITFLELEKHISKSTDQGVYQCLIVLPPSHPKPIVLSEKVFIQFKDVSTTTMELRIDEPFIQWYIDSSSKEYQDITHRIAEQSTKALSQHGKKAKVYVQKLKKGSVLAEIDVIFENVTTDERRSLCKSSNELSSILKTINGFAVLEVKTLKLDCCLPDTEGDDTFKGVYKYGYTVAGETIKQGCVYDSLSSGERMCVPNIEIGPYWSEPQLQNCPAKSRLTNTLLTLQSEPICNPSLQRGCSSAEVVASNLSKTVNSSDGITTKQDVQLISDIIKNLTILLSKQTLPFKPIIRSIFSTIDILLQSNRTLIATSEINSQSSTDIIRSIDLITEVVVGFLAPNESFQIRQRNIAMTVERQKSSNLTITAEENVSETVGISFDDNNNNTNEDKSALAKAFIPTEAFGNGFHAVWSVFYRTDVFFQSFREFSATNTRKTNIRKIDSGILKVKIMNREIFGLRNPVTLTFKRTTFQEGINLCSFWNFSLATKIPNVNGRWSTSGCYLDYDQSTEEAMTCKCDHLTNFAILLDVSQTSKNPQALRVFTWIGCGISLTGLSLTILSYLIFRKLLKKLPPKLLLCLCVSLILLLIIFLAGVEQTTSTNTCRLVAVFIQYFMLSTFFWMSVEALSLYRKFVKVFRSTSDKAFMIKSSLFAWGVPIIIVLTSALLAPENLGNDKFCIVQDNSFYFGVLAPVVVILIGNLVVLVLVMRSIVKRKRFKGEQDDALKKNIRIAFAVNVLLGTTWLFGVLAVGDMRDFFQWLFTIFNSLQGFFIFAFYTLRNKDVVKCWAELLCGLKGDNKRFVHESTTTNGKSISYPKNNYATSERMSVPASSPKTLSSSPLYSTTTRISVLATPTESPSFSNSLYTANIIAEEKTSNL